MTCSTNIALSLGGNIGDVVKTFRWAMQCLEKSGLSQTKASSCYRTTPVGCAPGTPDFINAVVTGVWPQSLTELHDACKQLEIESGRPAEHEAYASRTLDLDIVFFGDLVLDSDSLTIPHAEASKRLFVLLPLAEIAADWQFPGRNSTVNDVLAPFRGTEEYAQTRAGVIDVNL